MEIRVSIKGLEKIRKILLHEAYSDKETNRLFHKLGEDIVAEAKSNLQNNTNINSGTLLSSIRILNEDVKSIEVGTDLFYANYIEYGRGPVRPITAKFLHWVDKETGKDVFAKFANATEPSPFLEPAVISKTKGFVDIYAEDTNHRVVAA